MTYLLFAILGLGAGTLFASLAQSLVLTYKGSGVINVAVGAMAMYVAYTYAGLRNGRVMVPPLPNPFAIVEFVARVFGGHVELPSWPAFINVHNGLGFWSAFGVSLLVAIALGALVQLLIYRPLRDAPPLAKTVAATGVVLVIQAIVLLRYGTSDVQVNPNLPSETFRFNHTNIPVNRLLLLAIVVCLTLFLTALFKYTRFGLGIRAAAENEVGAMLVGISPNIAALGTWMLGTAIAGGVGVLYGSIAGLDPVGFVLFAIPALAAALLARMDSFKVAAAAGVLIGCAASMIIPLQKSFHWIPSGAPDGLPVILIIIVMIVRGRALPERGAVFKIRMPEAPEPRYVGLTAVTLIPLVAVGLIYLPNNLRLALINLLVGAVLGLSFVVIVGLGGQISLMQITFAGLAGLFLTTISGHWGVPFPLDGLMAMLGAGIVGVVVGLPALRIRGVQLAILTLGVAFAVENMVFDNVSILTPADNTGSVRIPSLFGFHFSVNGSFPIGSHGAPNATYGLFVLAVVALAFLFVVGLRRSDLGYQFLAVRANERAAASVGINVTLAKLGAFGIGSCLAGLAGVLTAYQYQSITSDPYIALASISALAFAYLGGISSISGAILTGTLVAGGFSFALLQEWFHLGKFQALVGGVGVVVTVVKQPEGIAGFNRVLVRRALKSQFVLSMRHSAAVPRADGGSRVGEGVVPTEDVLPRR